MRRLALLALLAVPAWAYTYYYSEVFNNPSGVNTSYWTVAGSTSTSQGWLTTPSPGFVFVMLAPASPNEVHSTLKLTASDSIYTPGVYSHLHRASTDTSLNQYNPQGSFIQVALTNVVFSGSNCSATIVVKS
ncbi:hypothetical protein [Paludibaculum fermentans]|uniref:Uncharacterized protein n=1 Tax=Paludibaculum fermentans TaxID=1473598 RepID=A0A7S7SK15_PALFE|nr:hypothetical protein [Paludibaculum fermentans]QOY87308.1 hypothetical protein IRI77_31850 [Paludibaculum fermentans]QOY90036.1 hypothetical protein IRI77_08810 [Paludibaculum fermentans]